MKPISFEEQQKISKELVFHYIKSSGPGGQNVNKRNTKVQLFFDIEKSKILSQEQKDLLQQQYPEKNIIITSHEERSQKQNKNNGIKKLFETIEELLTIPTTRITTRIPRSQKEKRHVDKTRQGQKKKTRSSKINLDNEE